MSSPKTSYVCQTCGHRSRKWLGRCPACREWSSLVEEVETRGGRDEILPEGLLDPGGDLAGGGDLRLLSEVDEGDEQRAGTGTGELDRVLGGGLVRGSLVLIGGDPGIGKSTLLLQVAGRLAASGELVLYVSGEESSRQIKMRAERLAVRPGSLYVMAESSLEKVLEAVAKLKPNVLVVDSIQTVHTSRSESAPGSVAQLRESTNLLMVLAKKASIATFLVGHVTKEGAIAGPRVLEHLVDTVLYFEGDTTGPYRILRAVKNRFGSTNEIGVFEMAEGGLMEVGNPSELFLSERPDDASGSVVVPCIEGTRPILVEIQALVGDASYGVAQRTATGIDRNRVNLLVAVLDKRLGLGIGAQDIFVNAAGGMRIDERAVDLGLAAAIVSSFTDRAVPSGVAVFGEVGLAGEVRGVQMGVARVQESFRLGFERCVLPASNLADVKGTVKMELAGVSTLKDALEELL